MKRIWNGLKSALAFRNGSLSHRMIVLYVGLSAGLVLAMIGVSEWKITAGLHDQAEAGPLLGRARSNQRRGRMEYAASAGLGGNRGDDRGPRLCGRQRR